MMEKVNRHMRRSSCLAVTSKFGICGMPIRVDTYAGCTFGCNYCFANYRNLGGGTGKQEAFSLVFIKNILTDVFDKKKVDPQTMIEVMIRDGYTWHCGGMSDPFQHAEYNCNNTRELLEITKPYGVTILFSTKTDTLYDCENLIDKDLHTFQLSVSNIEDRKDIETNVPDIAKRIKMFKDLKSAGFRVGIRIQPFIPNISQTNIIDEFKDADYFTIEGLKIVPSNEAQRDLLFKVLDFDESWFTNYGLLNLRPAVRERYYKPFIEKLESYNIPYSIADNDMRQHSSGYCCCGDPLIKKSTTFNTTYLLKKYGMGYGYSALEKELAESGLAECMCRDMFFSFDRDKYWTVKERLTQRFNTKESPCSPRFMYVNDNLSLF